MWQQFSKTIASFQHDPPPSWSDVLDFLCWGLAAFSKWCLTNLLFVVRTPARWHNERGERKLRQFLHEILGPQYSGSVEMDEEGMIFGRILDEKLDFCSLKGGLDRRKENAKRSSGGG
ncbi:hypothetical protein FKW77_008784 [Venturia effusa]|uniref:Uncharacterized protein n=1 Tax=Venturia effusa TaxID=50376 RepID=A0A517LED6_9PEZI|nr:hypothetical protein FKW77_008784 [Venturia effusa]